MRRIAAVSPIKTVARPTTAVRDKNLANSKSVKKPLVRPMTATPAKTAAPAKTVNPVKTATPAKTAIPA